MIRFLLCTVLSLLLSAGTALAAPAEAGAESALAREMTALMQDYARRLPATRVPAWLDPATFQQRTWTAHLDRFRAACRQQPQACALLLRDDLAQAAGAPHSERYATTLSALTDLCAEPPWNGALDAEVFALCGGQLGTAGFTALVWLELGYDELFLAYYAAHEDKRQKTIAWLAEQPAQDASAQAQRKQLESQVSQVASAKYFEAIDRLPPAAGAWMQVLLQAQRKKENARMLIPALNLARLSYQLGDVEQGDNWQRVATLLRAQQVDVQGCVFDTERARVDLAHAVAIRQPLDGAATIQGLLRRDCGYTVPALEFALAHLRAAQPAGAIPVLQLTLKACAQTAQCAVSRVQHLQDLLTIAQGREPELQKLAARWSAESRIGDFNAVERQIVWVLADALAANLKGRAAAQQLYAALDDQIYAERTSLTGVSPATLKNLARYDELSRLRIKAMALQGEVLWFDRSEALRAQSLLRRLRIKRWQQEFAGVRDDAARARLQSGLASLAALRDALAAMPGQAPLERALRSAMAADAAEGEALFREQYLQELAARKAEAAGASPRKAWLGGAGIDLLAHEAFKAPGQNFTSLGAQEAYLSWLRVPGGYVGTLALPDPQHLGQWGTHRLASRFVPVSEAMAASLALYRKLLQGVPIWRRTDGSFTATEQPKTGWVRAQSLSELGEAIYQLLLAPFQAELKGARRLVLSPDGELAYLPFETLSNSGVAILDGLDIAYVQSLAVHEELTARARQAKTAAPTLLSLADPDYQVNAEKAAGARAVPRLLATANWPPLPGTRAESAALSRLFPGAQQRLGAQASRKQLDQLQNSGKLKQYRILHFATHGYVDDERSALVLSMADGPDQGYLQDTDVLDLQLNSDLVLLSACDTGIGRNISGEGVMGLPYAFMLAGNSNTLMSLWPVDDAGTAAFMTSFMTKVRKGDELLAALNQTKREFARGAQGKAFSDPRIWAAFVQYGVGIDLRE